MKSMSGGFIKGADLSTMLELSELRVVYYDEGKERDLLQILGSYGINSVRLRLFVDPYDEEGRSYGAGCNDLERTVKMAELVKQAGMSFLLDLQYSDFWADPGKQILPKAWKDLSYDELKQKVYDYTLVTIERFIKAGCRPDLVQIGNELSNGLLWPYGDKSNRKEISELVSCGIKGARSADNTIPLMIHLDNGGNNDLYRRWFDDYFDNKGEDFEYIGLSYYPFWHGKLESLSSNMSDIAQRYDKDLIVAEVSMGYTMEDYRSLEGPDISKFKGMATRQELVDKVEYPMSIKGQSDFIQDVMERIKGVPGNRGCGFYYWEPAWIPVPGSGWATEASLKYMNDPGPLGNEWANQALFDYKGNALPALKTIRDF